LHTILAYHQVDDRPDFAWNRVSPASLRRQMEVLGDLSLEGSTFSETVRGTAPNRVGITFDDAFAGVIRHALPVLGDFGFRATIFLPTGWAGMVNSWDSRLVGRRAMHATWKELEKAVSAGWEIASHGVSHRDLTSLGDSALFEELDSSRRRIEKEFGNPVDSIAYPFGRTSGRVIALAMKAGYRFGCLSVPARSEDPFRIGRLGVRRVDTIADFRAKVGGGILYPLQVMKDRIAHFCSLGTPMISQKGGLR